MNVRADFPPPVVEDLEPTSQHEMFEEFQDLGPVPNKRPLINAALLSLVAVALIASVQVVFVARFLLDWDGILGSVVWGYIIFALVLYALLRESESREVAVDRIVMVLIWSVAIGICGILAWMLGYAAIQGFPAVTNLSFWTEDLSTVGPLDPGGGASHAIIGSFEQVGIATAVSVPIAIMTAVYLHEIRGRAAKPLRFIVESMSGLPSIVAGLLIFTIWVNGRGYSGIAGSAALAVLMLPTVSRTAEEVLRTVPDPLREAALALGAPQWKVVLRVVLPTARAGLMTATILGVARAVGETAPLILTSFGSDTFSLNPFSGAQGSLPLFVFQLIRQPNEAQVERAWGGMLVLILLVLLAFAVTRLILARSQRRLGRSR
jgi:phosphate transport system permease protein